MPAEGDLRSAFLLVVHVEEVQPVGIGSFESLVAFFKLYETVVKVLGQDEAFALGLKYGVLTLVIAFFKWHGARFDGADQRLRGEQRWVLLVGLRERSILDRGEQWHDAAHIGAALKSHGIE